jgi:hypothetical protein
VALLFNTYKRLIPPFVDSLSPERSFSKGDGSHEITR